jgi:hypothetical protein
MAIATLTAQIYALLNNAADLTAAIGRAFTTEMSEAWNLPTGVVYPVLAINMNDHGLGPATQITDFSKPRLQAWFISDRSKLECYQFADALVAKLHRQQAQLVSAGTLYAQYLDHVLTHVARDPKTTNYQAYVEFNLVA